MFATVVHLACGMHVHVCNSQIQSGLFNAAFNKPAPLISGQFMGETDMYNTLLYTLNRTSVSGSGVARLCTSVYVIMRFSLVNPPPRESRCYSIKRVGVSVAYPELRISSSSKRLRTELTITVKKAICSFKEKNPKATHEEIASVISSRFDLKIGRSTVGDILRQKTHWVSLDDSPPEAKRLRPAKHVDLERALFLWFSDIRARNVPISDEILQSKARFFGERLEINEFSYSRGWLQNFKKRTVHGEAGGVYSQVIASGREPLQCMLRDYTLDNIYNINEAGLFYRLEPNTNKVCSHCLKETLCANHSFFLIFQRLDFRLYGHCQFTFIIPLIYILSDLINDILLQ